jgi:hypothetical protein
MTNPWSELRNDVPTHLTMKPLRLSSDLIQLVLATKHDSLMKVAHDSAYTCSMT